MICMRDILIYHYMDAKNRRTACYFKSHSSILIDSSFCGIDEPLFRYLSCLNRLIQKIQKAPSIIQTPTG